MTGMRLWSCDECGVGAAGRQRSSEQRAWVTEQKHVSGAATYDSRKYVVAKSSQLVVVHQYASMCDGEPCIRSDAEHTLECMSDERNYKYRVRRLAHGYEDIVCLQFVVRSRNLIQLWMSRPSDTEMPGLCSEAELRRNEWPWIAQDKAEKTACPFSGGYTFRAYRNHRKMVCERIREASRLDADCVAGEGLHFSFPESYCNIFPDSEDTEESLDCFASWSEGSYTFIVASSGNFSPQYVLRVPTAEMSDRTASQQHAVITTHLYFSPICPMTDNGVSAGPVMFMTLKLIIAKTGSGHEPECSFPRILQGSWLLMQNRLPEYVDVTGGVLQSPRTFGRMVCKVRHRQPTAFTVVYVFSNGCQPRFTCARFDYESAVQVFRLRTSLSSSVDRPGELCQPQPGSAAYLYSDDVKVMYPVSRCRQHSCGLDGLVRVTVTSPVTWSSPRQVRACDGTLSDWNPFTCTLTSRMVLTYRDCSADFAIVHREYVCEAFIDLTPSYRLLFTHQSSKDDNTEDVIYSCWVIQLRANGSAVDRPTWLNAKTLTRRDCNQLPTSLYHQHLLQPTSTLAFYTDDSEKQCLVMTKAARRHGADVIRYSLRATNASTSFGSSSSSRSSSSGIATGRHRTVSVNAHQSSSVSRSAASCCRRPAIIVLLTLMMMMMTQ